MVLEKLLNWILIFSKRFICSPLNRINSVEARGSLSKWSLQLESSAPKLPHFSAQISHVSHKFFHFRLYQVRCSLKVSPKLPVQIETCIPEASTTATTGPCIVGGVGASKVFQILYRNEEVSLKDVIMFRAHLLGNKSFNMLLIYIFFSFSSSC